MLLLRTLPNGPVLLCLACSLAISCVAAPVREMTIVENQRGWVHLSKGTGSGFQASHPLSLDPNVITRTLTGIRVQPRQGKPTTLLFGPAPSAQAFSQEETEFLAPSIATALAGATAQQVVTFGAIRSMPAGLLSTAGIIYAHGPFLYVTMTQYRSGQRSGIHTDIPDFTRLYDFEIQFTPESVQAASHTPGPALSGLGELTTLVIDYARLAALPEPKRSRVTSVNSSDPPLAGRPGETDRQDDELERLRGENRALKRQLTDLAAEVDRLKNTPWRPR